MVAATTSVGPRARSFGEMVRNPSGVGVFLWSLLWFVPLVWPVSLYVLLRYATGHRCPGSRGLFPADTRIGRQVHYPSLLGVAVAWLIGWVTIVGFLLAIYMSYRYFTGRRAASLPDRLAQLDNARDSGLINAEEHDVKGPVPPGAASPYPDGAPDGLPQVTLGHATHLVAAAAVGKWACESCGTLNWENRSKCYKCEAKRAAVLNSLAFQGQPTVRGEKPAQAIPAIADGGPGSVLASSATEPTASSQEGGFKVCPQCAEEVKPAALICRYCRYKFRPLATATCNCGYNRTPPGKTSCYNCGRPLGPDPSAALLPSTPYRGATAPKYQ
jgi:hypothetical protein